MPIIGLKGERVRLVTPDRTLHLENARLCRYHHEGVARRKFWRDGRWHDADLYAILDEDWATFWNEGQTAEQTQDGFG
jgi:hypothetical protein